jgi:hypothetical protein
MLFPEWPLGSLILMSLFGALISYLPPALLQRGGAAAVFLACCVQLVSFVLSRIRQPIKPIMPSPELFALVTGASSGIGRACALALARRGFNLVLVARRRPQLHDVSREIQQRSGSAGVIVLVVELDVTSEGAGARILAAVEAHRAQAKVAVVVHAAGAALRKPFSETTGAELDSLLRLNVVAFSSLLHAFVPDMVSRREGRILVVGSIVGVSPQPTNATYGAAKAFMYSLCSSLRYELGLHGIGVTTLLPGQTATEFASVSGTGDALVFRLPTSSASCVAERGVAAMLNGDEIVLPGILPRLFWLCGLYCPHYFSALCATVFWQSPRRMFKYI